jgi:hypothetical protein
MPDVWLVYSPGGEIPEFEGVFQNEADAKTVAEQIGGQCDPVKVYAAGDTSLHNEYLWRSSAQAVTSMRVIVAHGFRESWVATKDSDGLLRGGQEVGVSRCESERNHYGDTNWFVSAYAETGEEAERLVVAKIREVVGPEVDSWEVRRRGVHFDV